MRLEVGGEVGGCGPQRGGDLLVAAGLQLGRVVGLDHVDRRALPDQAGLDELVDHEAGTIARTNAETMLNHRFDTGVTAAPGFGQAVVTALVMPAKRASRLVTSIEVE